MKKSPNYKYPGWKTEIRLENIELTLERIVENPKSYRDIDAYNLLNLIADFSR